MATKRFSPQRLLKEKPRRGFQLLGGFEEELTAHTPLALFVSLHVRRIDPQPRAQLLLRKPAEASSHRNASPNPYSRIAVEGGRRPYDILQLLSEDLFVFGLIRRRHSCFSSVNRPLILKRQYFGQLNLVSLCRFNGKLWITVA
jgi:hypothetical protein